MNNVVSLQDPARADVPLDDLPTVAPNGAALILSGDGMDRMMKLAGIMASGRSTVPKHLHGNTGDCMAVIMQAMSWRMNPFAVAQKTHLVNGTLGYEAQLINAAIIGSGLLKGRPEFEWYGDWSRVIGNYKDVPSKREPGETYRKLASSAEDEKGCGVKIRAVLKGEDEPRELNLLLTQAGVRNSPLWADDPRQQLAYLAIKRWARLYAPDVILGVYSPDELEDVAPPPAERDMGDAKVVPDATDRARTLLAGGKPEAKPAQQQQGEKPPTLDAVLKMIRAAETSDAMNKAAETVTKIADQAEKETAREAYRKRVKELRDAAAGPTYAELADKLKAAQSVAEVDVVRDLIRSVKADEQRAELTELANKRAEELNPA